MQVILLKHGNRPTVNIDLCKTLTIAHNQGMQDPQNKHSLFAWKQVPATPPRPQKFIDLDIADFRSNDNKKTVDYTITNKQIRQAAGNQVMRNKRRAKLMDNEDEIAHN